VFEAVRPSKSAQQIINQIRDAILEGKLSPGQKIASDRELTAKFGVSKQTLREALRALEYLGLVEIRQGAAGGAFVSEVDMDITKANLANFLHFKNISIKDLSEVRRLIEPHAARTAAERISAEDLDLLKKINETSQVSVTQGHSAELSRNEIKFHRIIANTTGNPILILILDFVGNLLEDAKKILQPGPEFSRTVVRAHEDILAAVAAGDAEKSARLMLAHVTDVGQELNQLEMSQKTAEPSSNHD